MLIDGISILTCVFSMICFSFLGTLKLRSFKPDLQPRSGAFSIWSVIYAFLIYHGVYICLSSELYMIHTIFICLSMLFSALWIPFSGKSWNVFVLYIALICGYISCLTYTDEENTLQIISHIGPNFLTSWLSIASIIGTIIYLKEVWEVDETLYTTIPFVCLNIILVYLEMFYASVFQAIFVLCPVMWTII